jgi:hypothetical protein
VNLSIPLITLLFYSFEYFSYFDIYCAVNLEKFQSNEESDKVIHPTVNDEALISHRNVTGSIVTLKKSYRDAFLTNLRADTTDRAGVPHHLQDLSRIDKHQHINLPHVFRELSVSPSTVKLHLSNSMAPRGKVSDSGDNSASTVHKVILNYFALQLFGGNAGIMYFLLFCTFIADMPKGEDLNLATHRHEHRAVFCCGLHG